MSFKIASWNVNSLNVRLPQVLSWLAEHQADVLALQELKMPDEKFPFAAFEEIGYHAICHGQRTYNGVAIISKTPTSHIQKNLPEFIDEQKRVIAATVEGIRVINLYIPNGESVESPKFQYKQSWLAALYEYLELELKHHPKLVVLGDFNIAPEPEDVHDPKAWEGHVLFSAIERQFFQRFLGLGLYDSFRLFSQAEKSFSWWDYRMNGFKRNLGLRIDHILISEALKSACSASYIDKNPRAAERPSDHAPVVVELNGF